MHSSDFFTHTVSAKPLVYQSILLKHDVSVDRVVKVFGVKRAQLKKDNPALTRFVWRGWRLIPAGYQLKLPYRSHQWKQQKKTLLALKPETFAPGGVNYRVKRGDTACVVARKFAVSCRDLILANRLNRKAVIRVGQKLIIPKQATAGQVAKKSGKAKTAKATTKDGYYTVKRGDTACGIAQRFNVGCRQLIGLNQLGRRAVIHKGQKLRIPSASVAAAIVKSTPPAKTQVKQVTRNYTVKSGDTACRIAARNNVDCQALIRFNKLGKKAVLQPGQRLKIPVDSQLAEGQAAAVVVAKVSPEIRMQGSNDLIAAPIESAETSNVINKDPQHLLDLLDQLPALDLTRKSRSGKDIYSIQVEADETLGHYADWLGIGGSSKIRQHNKYSRNKVLTIGESVVLPVKGTAMEQRFNLKRAEYHQVLSDALKDNYSISGLTTYQVKRGDSIWSISQQHEFPLWLLYRLNPELRNASPKPGDQIQIPELNEKT